MVGRVAKVVDDHEVILDAPILGALNTVEHVDHGSNLDDQAGFFENFSRDRRLERLAELHAAAGQTPFAFERFMRAPGQQDVAVTVEHDGADADNRSIGKLPHIVTSSHPHILTSLLPHILTSSHPYFLTSLLLPQIPITFTTTRFFRWPSNSA